MLLNLDRQYVVPTLDRIDIEWQLKQIENEWNQFESIDWIFQWILFDSVFPVEISRKNNVQFEFRWMLQWLLVAFGDWVDGLDQKHLEELVKLIEEEVQM